MPEVNVCITVQGENVLLFISSRFNFIHWEAILIDNIENIDMLMKVILSLPDEGYSERT
jgi:hypothetical protein